MSNWCTMCAAEAVFEVVPCPDGHGADCPEMLCLECGYVVVVASLLDPSAPTVVVPAA